MAGWKKELWLAKRGINPKDQIKYFIASDVLAFTERILREYDPHEGIIYWAGTAKPDEVNVTMAVAPAATTYPGEFNVDHLANAHVVLCLHEHRQTHVGQVHSHPGEWVDHSGLDDEQATFKKEGLLSLVVPNYGQDGMMPLSISGIHRLGKRTFLRLNNKYIKEHFRVIKSNNSVLLDLRKAR